MLEMQVTVSLDSVSHQLCKSVVQERYMRDQPERLVESNTKNSWLRYLNNMFIQGTRADALFAGSSSRRRIKCFYSNSRIQSRLFTNYYC